MHISLGSGYVHNTLKVESCLPLYKIKKKVFRISIGLCHRFHHSWRYLSRFYTKDFIAFLMKIVIDFMKSNMDFVIDFMKSNMDFEKTTTINAVIVL